MDPRRAYGNDGERAAEAYLLAKGMRVIARQARTPFGEIDLVCEDGPELVFVEVKARRSDSFGYPEEAVTRRKLRTMAACAQAFVEGSGDPGRRWRLDVVAVRPGEVTHFPAVDSPAGGW